MTGGRTAGEATSQRESVRRGDRRCGPRWTGLGGWV